MFFFQESDELNLARKGNEVVGMPTGGITLSQIYVFYGHGACENLSKSDI